MDFKAEVGPENVVTIKVVGIGGAGRHLPCPARIRRSRSARS